MVTVSLTDSTPPGWDYSHPFIIEALGFGFRLNTYKETIAIYYFD
jgi:hypothetical protein